MMAAKAQEQARQAIEQVLTSTLRMIRTSYKTQLCLFMQTDDEGLIRLRAADGIDESKLSNVGIKPSGGLVGTCMAKNTVIDSIGGAWETGLNDLLDKVSTRAEKMVIVPVAGQSRVLGVLILGPFPRALDVKTIELELRNAGALCAVLSAYGRLNEWILGMLPDFNHRLRTPLTAVQGSIGMVLGGMFGEVGTDVKEMLKMAHTGCSRTVNAIEDFLKHQLPKP